MMQNPGVLRFPDSHEGGWANLASPRLGDRTYRGEREVDGTVRVWIETKTGQDTPPERGELDLHLDVYAHSPSGFAWGYGGSGPAQLALALLVDALGDREMALRHYHDFKRTHVAGWADQWSITAEQIRLFVLSQVTREETQSRPRFSPGLIVSTPGVLSRVPPFDLLAAFARHLAGDWGELDEHDWQANEAALRDRTRLLSAYVASNGERFWIITEADRSSTTSLLPEEY